MRLCNRRVPLRHKVFAAFVVLVLLIVFPTLILAGGWISLYLGAGILAGLGYYTWTELVPYYTD